VGIWAVLDRQTAATYVQPHPGVADLLQSLPLDLQYVAPGVQPIGHGVLLMTHDGGKAKSELLLSNLVGDDAPGMPSRKGRIR
jgi:hypothetical protein